MKNISQTSVGQLVAEDYRTAAIFKKYGIDFCCQGSKTLRQACIPGGADPEKIQDEIRDLLLSARQPADDGSHFASWPLDLLADYIEKKHHRYVADQIPVINGYLEKLLRVHGSAHPELQQISTLFREGAADLSVHMKKEELMIFPRIKKLVMADRSAIRSPALASGFLRETITDMTDDHAREGDRLRQVSALSSNYTTPLDGCSTYRLTYDLLRAFEDDLHLHIHLENNILFPGALRLESAAAAGVAG